MGNPLCHPQHSTSIIEQYVTIFYANCITEAVLVETTATELCQLGIKDFCDIKTILHNAQSTTTDPRTSTTTNPADTTSNDSVSKSMKIPAAKLPTILVDMMQPQFCKFCTDWTVFRWITNLLENQLHAQHCNACDDTIQKTFVNTVPDFFALTEENFLHILEDIVTKKTNPAIHWLTIMNCMIKICFSWLWVQLSRMP